MRKLAVLAFILLFSAPFVLGQTSSGDSCKDTVSGIPGSPISATGDSINVNLLTEFVDDFCPGGMNNDLCGQWRVNGKGADEAWAHLFFEGSEITDESLNGTALVCGGTEDDTYSLRLDIDANDTPFSRNASFDISLVNVNFSQAAGNCSPTLSLTQPGSIPFQGGTRTLNVSGLLNECSYNVTVEGDTGMIIGGDPTGSDTNDRSYTITFGENLSSSTRSVTIRLTNSNGGNSGSSTTINITQDERPCELTLDPGTPSSFSFGPNDTSMETIEFSLDQACNWSVSGSDWLNFSPSGGSGDDSFTVGVDPRDAQDIEERSGSFRIMVNNVAQGPVFSVTQDGNSCNYSVDSSPLIFDNEGGSETVSVGANPNACTFEVDFVDGNPSWASIQRVPGSGNFTVEVSPNLEPNDRTATIGLTGNAGIFSRITVQQSGCSFEVSPFDFEIDPRSQEIEVAVSATEGCNWEAIPDVGWITAITGTGTGNGIAQFSVAANNGGVERSGTIDIEGNIVEVVQSGADLLAFSTDSDSTFEREGPVEITVERNGLRSGTVTVDVIVAENGTANAGSDYTFSTQTLQFTDGQDEATFDLQIVEDAQGEADESLTLRLVNAGGSALIGSTDEITITIRDFPNPTIGEVFFDHDLYGRRDENPTYAQDDVVRLVVSASDSDDSGSTPNITVNDAAYPSGGFVLPTDTVGDQTAVIRVRDIENNLVERSVNYRVDARPSKTTFVTLARTRDQRLFDSAEQGLYVDLSAAGYEPVFIDAGASADLMPIIATLGTHNIRVYGWGGNRNNPDSWYLSEPEDVQLEVSENTESPFRFRHLLPWYANSPADGQTPATVSSLAINNTGDTVATVRVSARRSAPASGDSSRFRQAEIHTIPARGQIVLNPNSSDFIGDLSYDEFGGGKVWSASSSINMSVLIESDSSFVTAGFGTYAAGATSVSPSQSNVPELLGQASSIVFPTILPDAGHELVITNSSDVATSVDLTFYASDGTTAEDRIASIQPYSSFAYEPPAGIPGYVVAEATEMGAGLVGTSFMYQGTAPSSTTAITAPNDNGPTAFFFPHVAYNLDGGSGANGDYNYRSAITINNHSTTQVTADIVARRGTETFTAQTLTLEPERHHIYDVAVLFGELTSSVNGLTVTITTSSPLVTTNLVTYAGNRNTTRTLADSPAQAAASTSLTTGNQLVFNMVNNNSIGDAVSTIYIMNRGTDAIEPELTIIGANSGAQAPVTLEAITPGATYAVTFAAEAAAGEAGISTTLAAPTDENFYVIASANDLMAGSAALVSSTLREAALALAPPLNKIKTAGLGSMTIIEGESIPLGAICPACDTLRVTINDITRDVPYSADNLYPLLSRDYSLTDGNEYTITIEPIVAGALIDEVVTLPLRVNVRDFIIDDGLWAALENPTTIEQIDTQLIVNVEGRTTLRGLEKLTNLINLNLSNVTWDGEPYDLDLSGLTRLAKIEWINDGAETATGIRTLTVPQVRNTREFTFTNVAGLETFRMVVAPRQTESSLRFVRITNCPDLVGVDLEGATLALPVVIIRDSPQLQCIDLPSRPANAGTFFDLRGSGLARLDNFSCSGFSEANSIFQAHRAEDFFLFTDLDSEGCLQSDMIEGNVDFINDNCSGN